MKKGQILAELDPTPFQQQVEQQQANVVKSKVDVANTLVTYNRQKKLADAGLIAQSDLDAAKAAYDRYVGRLGALLRDEALDELEI